MSKKIIIQQHLADLFYDAIDSNEFELELLKTRLTRILNDEIYIIWSTNIYSQRIKLLRQNIADEKKKIIELCLKKIKIARQEKEILDKASEIRNKYKIKSLIRNIKDDQIFLQKKSRLRQIFDKYKKPKFQLENSQINFSQKKITSSEQSLKYFLEIINKNKNSNLLLEKQAVFQRHRLVINSLVQVKNEFKNPFHSQISRLSNEQKLKIELKLTYIIQKFKNLS